MPPYRLCWQSRLATAATVICTSASTCQQRQPGLITGWSNQLLLLTHRVGRPTWLGSACQHQWEKYANTRTRLISTATVTACKSASTSSSSSTSTSEKIAPAESPLFSFAPRDLDLTVPLPKLKYPVVLVHGYLGYASLMRSPLNGKPLLEYFGSVRTHLAESSQNSITVITPVNPPAASIAARAKKLQMALGIKKQEVKETAVNEEDTKRTPTSGVSDSGSDKLDELLARARHWQPIEHWQTGGKFDASRHESDSAPLEQHQREASASPANKSDTIQPDTPAAVSTQTGSIKTVGDAIEERASEVETNSSSLILGGRSIALNKYEGKFHLIAHSMGGLDSRYLISQLQESAAGAPTKNRIASLTTVATPHRGSPIADMVLDVIDVPLFAFNPDPKRLAAAPTWNKFSQWLAGLFNIDVTGINNLSTQAMYEFNTRIKDHPEVKYLSYGGAKHFSFFSIWYWPNRWIRRYEERHDHSCDLDGICPGGENDGLVSVNSARWGEYIGTTSLDHLEQIGLGISNKHLPLYRQIVFRLHELEEEEEAAKKELERNSAKDQLPIL